VLLQRLRLPRPAATQRNQSPGLVWLLQGRRGETRELPELSYPCATLLRGGLRGWLVRIIDSEEDLAFKMQRQPGLSLSLSLPPLSNLGRVGVS
jgi:hypothetical protein